MSTFYDPELLAATSKMRSAADDLTANAEEWILGMISVPKSTVGERRPGDMPTYRRGWTFRLEEEMDFVIKPFTSHLGEPALAVVLRGETDEYFAGWFPAMRREDVAHIVSQLNHELHRERDRCRADETISIAIGSDFAPDAPWGSERVTVWADGRIAYVRRDRDGSTRRASGTVPAELWTDVSAALSRTTFPEQPDVDILPGGSVTRVEATGQRRGAVTVDYYDSKKMEGYGELVHTLVAFADAVRAGDDVALTRLGFAPA